MSTRAAKATAARARSASRPRASLKKKVKTFIALVALLIIVPIAIAAIYFLTIFVQVSHDLPSLAEIGSFRPSEGTQIFYSDGSPMATFSTENRKPVKLEEMGKYVVDATIATEDSRFYEHKGVDLHGIARAMFRNVSAGGEMREGASTITQQLARNINELGIGREKRLRRKVAEAILAMRMEQTFTKDEILEQYLNQIYYGNGAYGVEAAALTYFHKPAKKLSISEAALLAGIPQRPARYSDNLDAAYKRRDWVLQRMYETGKITAGQLEEAREQRLNIYKAEPSGAHIYGAPYFVNYVMQQLVADYGSDAVFSGWKIYTTLDKNMQKIAEETLRQGIKRPDVPANVGALISIDPRTGYIRAMVGGLDFKKNQFNVVTQGIRQPGSAFKPIVYTAAFDTRTVTLDSSFTDDPYLEGYHDKNWRPKNYSGHYSYGPMRIRTALRNSINTIAVKTAIATGLDHVIDYARRLGISTPIDKYPTLALGASGVRPIELCSAYTVFANADGRRAVPMGIVRVVDAKDEPVLDRTPHLEATNLSDDAWKQINEGLREVVEAGTGSEVQAVPDAHGKTGTTSESRDAWFAGYTRDLVTIIWAAHENRDKNGKLSRKEPYGTMEGATGGHLCAPIWRDYMLKAVPLQLAFNKAVEERERQAASSSEPQKAVTDAKKTLPAAANASQKNKPGVGKQIETTAPTGLEGGAIGVPATTSPVDTGASPGDTPGGAGLPEPAGAGANMNGAPRPQPSSPRPEPGARAEEPGSRLAAPTIDPNDEIVPVRICAESGKRATQWCSVTIEQRMRKRDRPGFCRLHRDPDR